MQGEESTAQPALWAATAAVQQVEQNFDPEKLKSARADHQLKHDRATSLQVRLAAEKDKFSKAEKRFKEWEAAGMDRKRVSTEISRCEAAMAITELALQTLRDTAPVVAQHLCNRIAT